MKNTVVVQVVLFPDGPPRSIILSRLQVEDALARMNAPTFQAGDVIERYAGRRFVVLARQTGHAPFMDVVCCVTGKVEHVWMDNPDWKVIYRAGKRVKG